MNPTQKRIVVALTAVTVLVFAAIVIASLGGSDEEPVTAAETTTASTAPTSSTTATTTSSTSTTAPATTTSTSTTTTSTTTTTTTTVSPTLVLREDGLGTVAFGAEADAAVTTIIAALGEPDDDSGWIPSFSGFGTCPGEQVRGLRWATLWALMTDGDTEWRSDGVPHFFSYLNVRYPDQLLGLVTEEGIGLGDTVEALKDAYGDRVGITFDEIFEDYVYNVQVPEPGRLSGGLTGDADDDIVVSIDGGVGCGE